MSEEKQASQPSVVDENLNPQSESSEASEAKQIEEIVSSSCVENANQFLALDSLNASLPNFDIVLSQLVLDTEANYIAAPNTVEDQIAAFEETSRQISDLESCIERMGIAISSLSYEAPGDAEDQKPASGEAAKDQKQVSEKTSSQMAELENFMERMGTAISPVRYVASGDTADKKVASGDAAAKKTASEDAAEQMAASGDADDQLAASWDAVAQIAVSRDVASGSYDLPPPKKVERFKDCVRKMFPNLLVEGNKLQDFYGITDIKDQALLETHHRLLYRLYGLGEIQNERGERLHPPTVIAEGLIVEVKRLYSLGYVFDLYLEGDTSDYIKLYPTSEETHRMVCATLVLAYTMLAFAIGYVKKDRMKAKVKAENTLESLGIKLTEADTLPDHPVVNQRRNINASLAELARYIEALQDAINGFSASRFF